MGLHYPHRLTLSLLHTHSLLSLLLHVVLCAWVYTATARRDGAGATRLAPEMLRAQQQYAASYWIMYKVGVITPYTLRLCGY
jgi:hypothetical protein